LGFAFGFSFFAAAAFFGALDAADFAGAFDSALF
jgi:hypothetical protein